MFSCVCFVCLIKLQRIAHCISGICSWGLYLLLLMSVFTIIQTWPISIVFLSLFTHVLYYMHYPFFLVFRIKLFLSFILLLMRMHDLSLMCFRNHFSCTCAWTYVYMPVGWHEESKYYISYNRIFFKTEFSKYRTLSHIHPLSILYLSFVLFFVEQLSVDDYQKKNSQ